MDTPRSPYALPLTELVDRARVAEDQQVTSVPQRTAALGVGLGAPLVHPFGDGAGPGDDD